MNYTVQIERSAQKQLAKISSPYFEAISEKILSLEKNPRPPRMQKVNRPRKLAHKGRRLPYYLQHLRPSFAGHSYRHRQPKGNLQIKKKVEDLLGSDLQSF
jgi:hypothetical protein